jgi:uncharacterized protein with beta-barrel porin domain
MKFRDDGNAHGFSLLRHGIALGADVRLSPDNIVGAAFRYTNPRLKQETGRVRADDFEIGLYGMRGGLPGGLGLKGYAGYSHQSYTFDRFVSIPETPSRHHSAFHERLKGGTGGHAVAASVELIKPIQWRDGLQIMPLAAFDYEKAWMDGYRESGGTTALFYDAASMERLTLRLGMETEYQWLDRLAVKTRVQYLARLAGDRFPAVGTKFVGASNPRRWANIRGNRDDGNYINLGLGLNWAVRGRKDMSVYVNYDAKFGRRVASHAGEVGFMLAW